MADERQARGESRLTPAGSAARSMPTGPRSDLKADKPRDDDAGESDVYILSGAEDLVPILDVKWARKTVTRRVFGVDYQVAYYRPRIEGLFSRIERWRACATGIIHWRTISRDNVATFFGDGPDSRVADPADASYTF